ncbi:MAG: SDR family oxidoreductase, partial [Bacteroidales bacterium]|nr:SDR family oxidoreductase [Bacteroidales bacterium]
MRIKFRGRIYKVLLRRKIIPVGFEEIIPDFYGTPQNRSGIAGDRLQGRVVLITGAQKGIGFAIASRLLREGAKVIITDRDEHLLLEAVRQLDTPNVAYMVWDITDGQESNHFRQAVQIFGKVDVLVNNAAIKKEVDPYTDIETATRDYIHAIHDTNVLATVRMCECFVDMFSSGAILNVLSNTAVRAAVGIYWMSKWALYGYTKGLSERLKGSGVTVNGICPGPSRTDMMHDYIENVYFKTPLNKRLGLPEEMAELALIQILSGLDG